MATFPTGEFSIYVGLELAEDRTGFRYRTGWNSYDMAVHTVYLVNESTVDPARFLIENGRDHEDGSWSGVLRIARPARYAGHYLDSSDGWLCAVPSEGCRWRFHDEGDYCRMVQEGRGRTVKLTDTRQGVSRRLRCTLDPGF
jgi:hypothetical protein